MATGGFPVEALVDLIRDRAKQELTNGVVDLLSPKRAEPDPFPGWRIHRIDKERDAIPTQEVRRVRLVRTRSGLILGATDADFAELRKDGIAPTAFDTYVIRPVR